MEEFIEGIDMWFDGSLESRIGCVIFWGIFKEFFMVNCMVFMVLLGICC